MKRKLNCHQFAEKIIEIRPKVLEILISKKKNIENWVEKVYFKPLGKQMSPNFRFYVLLFFRYEKQRV